MEDWTLNLMLYKYILLTKSGSVSVNMSSTFLIETVAWRFVGICRYRSMHS